MRTDRAFALTLFGVALSLVAAGIALYLALAAVTAARHQANLANTRSLHNQHLITINQHLIDHNQRRISRLNNHRRHDQTLIHALQHQVRDLGATPVTVTVGPAAARSTPTPTSTPTPHKTPRPSPSPHPSHTPRPTPAPSPTGLVCRIVHVCLGGQR